MSFVEKRIFYLLRDRPKWLWVLAFLHFVGGVGILFIIILAWVGGVDLGRTAEAAQVSPVVLFLSTSFLGLLGLVTGIGVLVGRPWGWWVTGFYYVHAIFRAGNALLVTIVNSDHLLADSTHGIEYYLLKYGGRLCVHVLILAYLFSRPVLGFFGLHDLSHRRALGKLGSGVFLLIAVGSATNFLTQ